jgi:hypothetical protein
MSIVRGSGRPTEYRLADGTRVSGVTTILGRFKESGALIRWAWGEGKAGRELYEKRDAAADVGSHIHAMVEADIHGRLTPTDPVGFSPEQVSACVSGFKAWESWRRDRHIEIVVTEVPLVSERYRFGGTLDVVWRDSGGLCMGDWKSSAGVYSDYLLQLAAYGILWEEHYPDQPITGGYHLARFSKEHGDFSHHHWPDLSDAREMFLLLVKAYELDKRLRKRAG